MKLTGTILNVGDGDAIILELYKKDKSLLLVIDGGDRTYTTEVREKVKEVCHKMGKKGPDIVVCTHYDSDHIAGVIEIAKYFKNNIGSLWIHQPLKIITDSFAPVEDYLTVEVGQQNTYSSNEASKINNALLAKNFSEADKLIIESITQVKNLFHIIESEGIATAEPFAQECFVKDWPEIEVLGPTRDYYKKIFSSHDPVSLIIDESSINHMENSKPRIPAKENPCLLLKTSSNITPTNKASVILSINIHEKKLLFTGDAGIESMEEVLNYPDSIKNIHFLKIPHHGSNNNISKDLINLMNPVIAYNSGDRHEDEEVILCLKSKKNRVVRTTKTEGDLKLEIE